MLIDLVTAFGERADRVTHARSFPAREPQFADWPEWVSPEVVHAWQVTGIERPWRHQVEAAQRVWENDDVVIATGTASGKSLGFWLPVTQAAFECRAALPTKVATTLYISPTKALGHDQLSKLVSLPLQGVRAGSFDGDTSEADRQWARQHGNIIFTNPDMLHRSILPGHERFRRWFKNLRFVVIDEAHRYRGVFGSHVALVLRRLLRVAALYGARPVVVGASATMADPAGAFGRFTGREAYAVKEDTSPKAAGTFLLWEPPFTAGDESQRRSTISEATSMLVDTTCAGVRSIAFIASRAGAEALADSVRNQVGQIAPELTTSVAAYRGGYLPEERRALETGLRGGKLRTVASTSALELGIDISGLDVVVIAGWPGTLASLWQQAGRAGRAGQEWLAVLIARDDPLDTFVVHNPEHVFDAPVEAGVIHPENPYVVAGHLLAAAAEEPLTEDDCRLWFGERAVEVARELAEAKYLRARPTGWFWAKAESAAALTDIRGSGGAQVRLVDQATGMLLGTVDDAAAPRQSFPGAVYVHQGETFSVLELDLAERVALVAPATVDYTTQARSVTEIRVVATEGSRGLPSGCRVFHGAVEVTTQVTGYIMRQNGTGVVLGERPLDLPAQTLRTHAVWWTAPDAVVEDAEVLAGDVPGAVHAAEHASIGLLPLFAGCDRWDIGGVSTARHADTGQATVFVYDGQSGGAGFAERGFEVFEQWQRATLDAIDACECVAGCPSCVQSPKCGNGNEPLDKDAALRLLREVLG